jgi:hypothetical protein
MWLRWQITCGCLGLTSIRGAGNTPYPKSGAVSGAVGACHSAGPTRIFADADPEGITRVDLLRFAAVRHHLSLLHLQAGPDAGIDDVDDLSIV